MEQMTPYILLFATAGMLAFSAIGFMIGWFANDIIYAFLNKTRIVPMHPEMFDEHGNVLPDEIVAFRFENSDDFDDEQDED
jgi:hypothetical protein